MEKQLSETAACQLLSIGHSNHELPHFMQLLHGAGVTAVADVRSQPFSRRHPEYNRQELARQLKQQGIAYVFLGEKLGGRPSDSELYDDAGRVNYERVRATTAFCQGLDRLVGALARYRVVMLCSEEDPLDCHRGLMIAPALVERDIEPAHIRADGSVETTAAMEDRLLADTRVGKGIVDGLFAGQLGAEERQQLLHEAYRLMAQRKAFRLQAQEPDGGGQ
jgi:uncharacterized protein (DUF488 family)